MKPRIVLISCILVSISIIPTLSSTVLGGLDVLDTDNLLLLNVAVKAHLVENLSDTITRMQTVREKLTSSVKQCLANVSKTAHACRKCVKDACETRAIECKLNVTRLEAFVVEEDSAPIPGVQFLRQPAPVQQGLQGLTQNAKKDILDGVPSNLRGQSEGILTNTETKLQTLQDRLQNSVHELPGVIPRMHSRINNMEFALEDPDVLNNMASIAADSLAGAMQNQDIFQQSAGQVLQQLPSVMSHMNQKLQRFSSAVGNFMSVANHRLNNIRGQSAQVPQQAQYANNQWQQQSQQYPNQQYQNQQYQQNQAFYQGNQWSQNGNAWNTQGVINGQQAAQGLPQQTAQQQWISMNAPQQNFGGAANSWASNPGTSNVFISQNGVRRFKRAVVKCENLKANPEKACQEFHFQCPACLNETNIMKHACGNDTIQKMVEIKKLDLLSAKYLMSYHQYMKNGLIVMQVEYDKDSYSKDTKTYKKALVTAKIGKEIITYETPLLPNIADLGTSGGAVGEEIWKLLQEKKVFDLEMKKSTTSTVSENKHLATDHSTMELQSDHDTSSAAAMSGVFWSVIGVVMYIGIHAFLI